MTFYIIDEMKCNDGLAGLFALVSTFLESADAASARYPASMIVNDCNSELGVTDHQSQ